MYIFRKLKETKGSLARVAGKSIMLSLAVTLLFLMLNVVPSRDAEARTRGAPSFGIYMILVNPAHVRYDSLFLPEGPAPFALSPGGPSYVAEMVLSARMAPSVIILPDGVRIASEKIRPSIPPSVVVSGRVFDHRIEIPPKMEKVYVLRIDNPPTGSSGIGKVEITVLYE